MTRWNEDVSNEPDKPSDAYFIELQSRKAERWQQFFGLLKVAVGLTCLGAIIYPLLGWKAALATLFAAMWFGSSCAPARRDDLR